EYSLHNQFVDLRVASGYFEAHLLALLAFQAADDETHALENLSDRHQAHTGYAFAHFPKLPFQNQVDLANRAVSQAPISDHSIQAAPRNNEIAHHAHQIVDARHLDANKTSRCRRRFLALFLALGCGRFAPGTAK